MVITINTLSKLEYSLLLHNDEICTKKINKMIQCAIKKYVFSCYLLQTGFGTVRLHYEKSYAVLTFFK